MILRVEVKCLGYKDKLKFVGTVIMINVSGKNINEHFNSNLCLS